MRGKISGATPKDEAGAIVVEAIARAYRGLDSFIAEDETPAYRREVRKHLAKAHNHLLDQLKLDGMALDDNPALEI